MSGEAESAANEKLAAEMRVHARAIFAHALAESSIARAFEQHVNYSRGILRVVDDLYDVTSYPRVFVAAFGKAAHAMAEALTAQMGPNLTGIIAAPFDPPSQLPSFRYFRGGHPLPTQESLRAGDAILKAAGTHRERSLMIFLISGGGSSIVEKSIDPDIGLEDIVATHRALVLSGAPIAQMNAVRKHVSAIKGGRLARACAGAQQLSIMVSDVPETALDSLSSGPTMPDSSTTADCYAIAQKYDLLRQLPASVRELFERHALEETPKSDDAAFARSRWWAVLSSATSQKAAAAKAAMEGFAVEIDNQCDDWDYARAADHLLARVRTLRRGASRVALISAGEVTVAVGGNAGTGGRNQQFALYCAQKIQGEKLTVLSAGTDGIDGNSAATGAIADGTTWQRAAAAQLDPAQALAGFNAHPLFEQLGDTIVTGPTGTNVRDVRVLLAY
jgi:hydroxypyruvate reductase